MHCALKKSKITAWWVAKKDNIFSFINVCSKEELTDNLVVVGYMKDSIDNIYPDLATSSNYVVEVTKRGVITAKGSFYPFEEAHALYIIFLGLLNEQEGNVVVASHWELLSKNRMKADIVKNGEVCKDVTFDFDSEYENITISGFSEELNANIIISPFSRRELFCAALHIPYTIKDTIKGNAEFAIESEKTECINRVRNFINGG